MYAKYSPNLHKNLPCIIPKNAKMEASFAKIAKVEFCPARAQKLPLKLGKIRPLICPKSADQTYAMEAPNWSSNLPNLGHQNIWPKMKFAPPQTPAQT